MEICLDSFCCQEKSESGEGESLNKTIVMEANIAAFNVILACILSIAIYNLTTKGHKWLSLLVLSYGIHSLLKWGLFSENHFILVYFPVIAFPAIFLRGSIILLYTNRILFDDKNKRLLRHMIVPGISGLVHMTLLFAVPNEWTVAQIKNQTGIHRAYTLTLIISMFAYNTALFWIAFSRIIKYKRRFKDNFSNDMIKNTRWLFYFVITNLGIMTLLGFVVTYCLVNNMGIPFTIVEEAVLLALLLFFIYYLITKPEILPVTQPKILPVEGDVKEKPGKKYAKINLPDETRKKYAKKLETFMLQEQAFLNENISIHQVSKELNIPQHHLSITINIEFEQNFYNYVNCHRIRYAEDLLKDPEKNEESILMIACLSGFQSKSSFNKFFKSFYGMTPSKYRHKSRNSGKQ